MMASSARLLCSCVSNLPARDTAVTDLCTSLAAQAEDATTTSASELSSRWLGSLTFSPEDCVRETCVHILPNVDWTSFVRVRLLAALHHQLHLLKVCWWISASSVDFVHASLRDLCDGLDRTRLVSGDDHFLVALRLHTELQREHGKCNVFVLDGATVPSAIEYCSNCAPRWGAHVVVIPAVGQEFDLDDIRPFVGKVRLVAPEDLSLDIHRNDDVGAEFVRALVAEATLLLASPSPTRDQQGPAGDEVDVGWVQKCARACRFDPRLTRAIAWAVVAGSARAKAAVPSSPALIAPAVGSSLEFWQLFDREQRATSTANPSAMVGTAAAILRLLPRQLGWTREQTRLLWALVFLPRVFPSCVPGAAFCAELERCGVLSCTSDGRHVVADSFLVQTIDRMLTETERAEAARALVARVERGGGIDSTVAVVGRGGAGAKKREIDVAKTCDSHHLLWARWRPPTTASIVTNVRRRRLFFPKIGALLEPAAVVLVDAGAVPQLPPLPNAAVPVLALAAHSRCSDSPPPLLVHDEEGDATEKQEEAPTAGVFVEAKRAGTQLRSASDETRNATTSDGSAVLPAELRWDREAAATMSRHAAAVESEGRYLDAVDLREKQVAIYLQAAVGGTGGTDEPPPNELLLAAIAVNYREVSRLYAKGALAGVAQEYLDRCQSVCASLLGPRRDTPGRAVSLFHAGVMLLDLSDAEARRGTAVRKSAILEADPSDMQLRAAVRSDVEREDYLRSAGRTFQEVLAAYHATSMSLVGDEVALCHASLARAFANEHRDREALQHAEMALDALARCRRAAPGTLLAAPAGGATSVTPQTTEAAAGQKRKAPLPDGPRALVVLGTGTASSSSNTGVAATPGSGVSTMVAATAAMAVLGDTNRPLLVVRDEILWACENVARLLTALGDRDYVSVLSLLDQSPYLALCGHAPEAPEAAIFIASDPYAALFVRHVFPTPIKYDHLQLLVSFTDKQVAKHHGLDWETKPMRYVLPAHAFLQSVNPQDPLASAVFDRFLACGVNPNACSPDDMKTLLHVAVERGLGFATLTLLRHPLVRADYTAPYVLSAKRQGLSTIAKIEQRPCPLSPPLLLARGRTDLLLQLLLGGSNPRELFMAFMVFIVEELSVDDDAINHTLRRGADEHHEQPLSEGISTRQQLQQQQHRQWSEQVSAASFPTVATAGAPLLLDISRQEQEHSDECRSSASAAPPHPLASTTPPSCLPQRHLAQSKFEQLFGKSAPFRDAVPVVLKRQDIAPESLERAAWYCAPDDAVGVLREMTDPAVVEALACVVRQGFEAGDASQKLADVAGAFIRGGNLACARTLVERCGVSLEALFWEDALAYTKALAEARDRSRNDPQPPQEAGVGGGGTRRGDAPGSEAFAQRPSQVALLRKESGMLAGGVSAARRTGTLSSVAGESSVRIPRRGSSPTTAIRFRPTVLLPTVATSHAERGSIRGRAAVG